MLSARSVTRGGLTSHNVTTHRAMVAEAAFPAPREGDPDRCENRVVGYVYYRPEDKQFVIEKLEIDPAFEKSGVREKLMKEMFGKLTYSGRNKLVFNVHIDDTALQMMLRDTFGFSPNKKQPLVENIYKGAKAVSMEFVMIQKKDLPPTAELAIYDPKLSQDNGVDPAAVQQYNTRGELLIAMQNRLESLTGVAWELVKPGEGGVFVKEEMSRHIRNDKDLRFRTLEPIANPQAARQALLLFFGKKPEPSHTGRLQMPAVVDFPTEWVRPTYMRQLPPEGMKAAFARAENKEAVAPGMKPRDTGEAQVG